MTVALEASEFFPPTDRELALRGVIHTGWSTVAAKQPKWLDYKLPHEDVAKIQDVLHRAEAIERVEEIQVGLFMLKHRQMIESCRGDGVNSCRICGIHFSQRSDLRKPTGVQLCAICLKGVCQRCKTLSKSGKGEMQILCKICANEKELWRRSGAWLNNIVPSISLTDDELMKAKEQQEVTKCAHSTMVARSGDSLPRAFVNPARLESSDDTDEEEIETLPTQDLGFMTKTSSDGTPLPSLKFMRDLHPKKAISPPNEPSGTLPRTFVRDNSTKEPLGMKRSLSAGNGTKGISNTIGRSMSGDTSQSEEDVSGSRHSLQEQSLRKHADGEGKSSSRGVSRRAAISRKDKAKMEESRKRAKQKRDSRSPSSTSGNEGTLGDRSSSCKESTASPSPVHVPQITLQKHSIPSSELSSQTDNMSSQGSSELTGIEESREFRTGSQGFEKTSNDTTTANEFQKVSTSSKDDSLHYSQVEFSKTKASSKDGGEEIFAKVTAKKSPTSDIPKDYSAVHYSQVDFTKTSPKTSVKDAPVEFAKVKSTSKPFKMATITEVAENHPPVPQHRRQQSGDKNETKDEPSPKIPSRSASLKRKAENAPIQPIARTPSPKQKRTLPDIPIEQAAPPHIPVRVVPPSPTEKQTSEAVRAPVPRARVRKSEQPPLPLKDDPPAKIFPPLPPKDDTPAAKPPLPLKDDSPSSKPTLPPLPPKEDTPKPKARAPPLPPKDDTPAKPPLPEKEMPPLPPKDRSSQDSTSLGPALKHMTRGAKARSSISNRAVMGNLLDEFRKKQAQLAPPELPEKVAEDTDPSKASPESSDLEKKQSPRGSPLRRRNATRTSRVARDSKSRSGSDAKSQPTSGEDFPDGGEDSFQFRRRSSAVRNRPNAATKPDELDLEPDMPRGRTRSSAVGKMQRPARRMGSSPNARKPVVSREEDDGFQRVSPRPRSSSPAPDGLCGSIEVSLAYDKPSLQLMVTVVRCKGLRSMDANGSSDPYVNIFLAPGSKTQDVQTDIKFKTLNPEFNESFTFDGITVESMSDKQLFLVVMDYDEFSKDDFIGATRVNLYELLIAQGHSLTLRRLLDDREVPHHRLREKKRGRIELKMTYSTTKECFTVLVKKADELLKSSTKGVSRDSFIKCHVNCKGNIMKRKTMIYPQTVNPEFNEELQFNIKLHDLPFCRMTITAQDHKKIKGTFLGEVHFDSISFWHGFMSDPNQVIEGWYNLKPLQGKYSKKQHEMETYLPSSRRHSMAKTTHQMKSLIKSISTTKMKAKRVSTGASPVTSPTETPGKSMNKYHTLPTALFQTLSSI